MHQDSKDNRNGYPHPAVAWLTLAVLFLAYVSSFIDRFIMTLLIEPIKADMGLNDTQVSLLHGFAFAIFYTLVGLPLGRMVDLYSRTRIASIGVAVWSIMTMACGLTHNYWQLFLTRIGVGVGEGTLSPAAYSIIADTFPRKRLGIAMGVYNFATSVGGGLAFMIGGYVVKLMIDSGGIALPVVGQLKPWQAVFFVVGAPGLLIAVMVALLKEPRRLARGADGNAERVPVRAVIDFLKAHRAPVVYHHIGVALTNLGLFGVVTWFAPLMIRVHGWKISDIGFLAGGAIIVGGLVGLVGGGWLGDRASHRDPAGGKLRVCMGAVLLAVPCAIIYPLSESATVTAIFWAVAYGAGVAPIANGSAILQQLMPGPMRGLASAFYLFVINIIGTGFGATVVAVVTDIFFPASDGLRYSLAIVSPIIFLLAAFCFWRAIGHFRSHMQIAADT
jgi:MFS family permease